MKSYNWMIIGMFTILIFLIFMILHANIFDLRTHCFETCSRKQWPEDLFEYTYYFPVFTIWIWKIVMFCMIEVIQIRYEH